MADSAVVWSGKSRFGGRVVAIVTGMDGSSKNEKTGAMAQLFILRADRSPLQTLADGLDYSCCGTCKHSSVKNGGADTCYVTVAQSPQAVWRTWRRGGYRRMTARQVSDRLRARGLSLRLGAYGDPAALPVSVLYDLSIGIKATGYTHAWATSPEYRPYVMASVDTPEEYAAARAEGWRTFRVTVPGETLQPREISCPASEEMGMRTTCSACTLCDGARIGDTRSTIAIQVHGSAAAKFIALRAV